MTSLHFPKGIPIVMWWCYNPEQRLGGHYDLSILDLVAT